MKNRFANFEGLTLTILAALGLELGCAVGPGAIGSSETGDGDRDTGDGDTGDGDGDPGDGDGDPGDGDGDTPVPYTCENPVPIMQLDTDLPSGFVRCEDGFVHRVEAVECVAPHAQDSSYCAEFMVGCESAADCLDKPYGSCSDGLFGECWCHYGCSTDADCDPGYACACAGVVDERSTCILAGCTTDEACGAGLCGLSDYDGCCGTQHSLACAGADADCHVDAECGVAPCQPGWPEGGDVDYQCSANGNDAWSCQAPGWCGCDCGRPFFVDGDARVAPVRARADWTATLAELRAPSPELRQTLAAYWTKVGQFEHASVASFARFALQLLQLGAPPILLADTQAAAADEIEHARLAFALASAYAGAPVGPGALAVEACLTRGRGVRAIVEGLIIEACVGETLAAIEAQEAALQARDPALAEVLRTIADDELRHARLGWRSLHWILAGADAELRWFALQTLEAAIEGVAGVANEGPMQGHALLRAHGVVDDQLRAELREAGLATVVRPCAAALRRRFAPCSPDATTSTAAA